MIVVAIKKLDLLKGLGAGIVAAEVRVHAQEQVQGRGAYESAGSLDLSPTPNKTRVHSGPVFPSHWEGLGKPLPSRSLSSLMSINKRYTKHSLFMIIGPCSPPRHHASITAFFITEQGLATTLPAQVPVSSESQN